MRLGAPALLTLVPAPSRLLPIPEGPLALGRTCLWQLEEAVGACRRARKLKPKQADARNVGGKCRPAGAQRLGQGLGAWAPPRAPLHPFPTLLPSS